MHGYTRWPRTWYKQARGSIAVNCKKLSYVTSRRCVPRLVIIPLYDTHERVHLSFSWRCAATLLSSSLFAHRHACMCVSIRMRPLETLSSPSIYCNYPTRNVIHQCYTQKRFWPCRLQSKTLTALLHCTTMTHIGAKGRTAKHCKTTHSN